jgi:hypothetical protein
MIQDWHTQIKVKTNSLDKQSFIRLQPEIVDIFINDAIDLFVKERYRDFESTQKRSDELNPLVSEPKDLVIEDKGSYYKATLPPDYFFHLTSDCKIKVGDKEGEVFLKKMQLDDKTKILNDPFNTPNDIEVNFSFQNDSIFLYSKYPVTKFTLTYLKKPTKVDYRNNISSEFDGKSAEKEIINLVVTKLLENYESQRINTQSKIPIE